MASGGGPVWTLPHLHPDMIIAGGSTDPCELDECEAISWWWQVPLSIAGAAALGRIDSVALGLLSRQGRELRAAIEAQRARAREAELEAAYWRMRAGINEREQGPENTA